MNAKATAAVKAMNDDIFAATGKRPSAAIHTFGCQMNAHDSEKLAGMAREMGYALTNDENAAALVVYNTCCVRENAENRLFGNLGTLIHRKKNDRDFRAAVCGCMTQQDSIVTKIREKYPLIDIVFGTFNLADFPDMVLESLQTGRQVIRIEKDHGERPFTDDLPTALDCSWRASVNIMYGCDNFCSYCIVPHVRGRERSRPFADVLREINGLAETGVKEIMLLGQNVNSYGKGSGSGDGQGTSFAELIGAAAKVTGIERVRFMTSHPKDLSDELIRVIAENPVICRHIHLPMQSGSSRILEAMNRGYTKDDYLRLVSRIRAAIPDAALSTDIIVGFPGETEGDFAETLDAARKARFNAAFTFIYSKREGTPAADMPGQVPKAAQTERFKRLLDTLNPIFLEENEKFQGKTLTVMAEEPSPRGEGYLTGRTGGNHIVHFKGDGGLIGGLVNVRITGVQTFYMTGEMASEVRMGSLFLKTVKTTSYENTY